MRFFSPNHEYNFLAGLSLNLTALIVLIANSANNINSNLIKSLQIEIICRDFIRFYKVSPVSCFPQIRSRSPRESARPS